MTTYGTWANYKKELHSIINMCKKTNLDWLTLVIGDEGSGKTTFSIESALEVDRTFNIKKQLVYNLEQFSNLTLDFMGKDKDDVKRLKAIIWDEAVDSLFSRNYASPIQKDLVRLYIKNRSLQHFTFINIPSPFYVDLYLRAHRAKMIAYCFLDRDNLNKRYVALYFRNSFKNFLKERNNSEYLMLDRPAFIKTYKPDYIFEFKSLQGKEIWTDYEQMKYDDQKKTIKKIGESASLRNKAEATEVTRYMPMSNFLPWLSTHFTAMDKKGIKRDGYLYFSYEILAKEGYTSKANVTYLVNKAINEGLIYKIGSKEYQIQEAGKKLLITNFNKD